MSNNIFFYSKYLQKKKIKLIICFISFFLIHDITKGQPNYFDVSSISALIVENKQNYSDHQTIRDKQILSQSSVLTWKSTTLKMKNLVDAIDKRMNKIFIITADAGTALNMYQSISTVIKCQQQALALAIKYPWLVLWSTKVESIIISDATEISGFLYLIILTYGDINKMTVASRKQIYTELEHQMLKIVQDAQFLVTKLKMVDFAEKFKNTPIWQGVNNDKKLVTDILKGTKF